MATIVSIGSNQSIDTETPASSSGAGPLYTVTFGTTPTGIAVGDIGFMDTEDAGGGNPSDYTFLVTVISGADITLKYLTDTGSKGVSSPFGLYTGAGSSGSPTQAPMVFKRAFSTITLFEAMVDDASPTYWGTTDDVVGECHADSAFTDSRVYFDNKQSLASVKLTVHPDSRHDGTAGSGAVIRPTAGSGHNNAIIDVNIDNFTVEWLDIDFTSLDAQNTNKAVLLRGVNDNFILRNNLIHDKYGNPGNTGPHIIHIVGAGVSGDTMSILNNIIYSIIETSGDSTAAVNVVQWAGTLYIYNNTVHHVLCNGSSKASWAYVYGNVASAVINIKNNIATKILVSGTVSTQAQTYRKFIVGSTENASNNLSDDSTTGSAYKAPGADSIIDGTLASVYYVSTTEGAEDLHITSDSSCWETGVDLGATNEVNIDIDGVDRDATGVTWDIGADQASVSDAGSPAFMMFLD